MFKLAIERINYLRAKVEEEEKTKTKVLTPEEKADFEERLGSRNAAKVAAAVKQLAWMHSERLGATGSKPIVSGVPGGDVPMKIKAADYKVLEKQAAAGDKAALQKIMSINASDIIV